MNHEKALRALFRKHFGICAERVELLTPHASGRTYCRLSAQKNSVIGTYSSDAVLNRKFFEIGKLLDDGNVSVPKIIRVDETGTYYLQTDVGNMNALEYLHLHPERQEEIVRRSLDLARQMHLVRFDSGNAREIIQADLVSFKNDFVIPLFGNAFSTIDSELEKILSMFDTIPESTYSFTHRDFQLRNIVVSSGHYSAVDYQAAFCGPKSYDVASLLFSSKLRLSESEIEDFVGYYGEGISIREVYVAGLCRILQALGAYGKIGIKGGMRSFLKSVAPLVVNLRHVLRVLDPENEFFVLWSVSQGDLSFAEFGTELPITITSFSYAAQKVPILLPHRLNFVFDARLFHNPGRDELLKMLTGKDEAIQKYLLQYPEFFEFTRSIVSAVNAARSSTYEFSAPVTEICVYIGCTGGRHRSVAAAELVGAALQKISKVVAISHLNLKETL